MEDYPRQPVTGRMLWTRADLRESDWLWPLAPAEIADLDAALLRLQARGLAAGEFERADFDLPVLGPRLAAVRDELLEGRGFAVLRGLPVERYSVPELEIIYWGIGTHLGRGSTQNEDGNIISHVTMHDERQLAAQGGRMVRGYQDRRYQEPHNDRADLVGLLCVRTARSGGSSAILNSTAMVNDIMVNHPEYLPYFFRGFRLWRGDTVTDEPAKVFSWYKGKLYVWYSSRNIERAIARTAPLPAEEQAAIDYLTRIALEPKYRVEMDMIPGDMQFVSNYTVMHSRTAYEDHDDPARWRLLLRLWLNVPEYDTALDPEFAKYTRRTVYPERKQEQQMSGAAA